MRSLRSFLPTSVSESGQTLVEVVVAIALTAVIMPAMATAIIASSGGNAQEKERIQADALLREAEESVRVVREKGWSSIPANGTYHPTISGSSWNLVAANETINEFTRQVVIADVQRDSSGDIVASGGIVDPSTRKAIISVSWTKPLVSTITSTVYLHRYANNTTSTAVWPQTSLADFTAGVTKNNVALTNNAGGEVQLANATSLNWGSPSVQGSYNATGNIDASDVFSAGNYAYLSNGTLLTILDITDPTTPTLVGTYTASATINHVYVSGNYAYLATTSDTAEVIVVNITNPAAPVLAANENLAGTADASATFVSGNYAYVGRVFSATASSFEFQILDITTPTNPTPTGGIESTGNVTNIKVSGNFAFMSTTVDTQEMLVANVTSKTTPTTAGSYNAAGTADGTDLGIEGNTIYLSTLVNAGGAEVFSINVTTPGTPTLLDTYEVNGTVTGVSPLNGQTFLSTGITNRQLIVLDSASPSNLLLDANLNLGSLANDARAYGNFVLMATGSNTQELMVVGPATVINGFMTPGTFESSSFDAGAGLTAGFNYITFTTTKPALTNVQIQVAANNDNTTWNYVGPDGTASTFYTSAGSPTTGPISMPAAGGRYFRYRATLSTTNTAVTPILSDVTINYSP